MQSYSCVCAGGCLAGRAGGALYDAVERPFRSICANGVSGEPCWQFFDFVAGKAVGNPDVIGRLQVKPELRTRSEPVAEPKRRIARDRPFPLDDLRDPVRRHGQLPRQFGRGDGEFLKLVGEDFTGMDGGPCHALAHL